MIIAVRDLLDDLLGQVTLLTIAAAIALGYAVLDVAQGLSALVLSGLTEQNDSLGSSFGTLTLDVGSRRLEFAQLVSGVVILAVVLAAILYVLRPDQADRDLLDEEPAPGE
jgi:hypothetical protein